MHEPQTRYKLLEVLGRIYDALLYFYSTNLYGGTATNFNKRRHIYAQFALGYDCVKSVIWSQLLETPPCQKQGLLDTTYVVYVRQYEKVKYDFLFLSKNHRNYMV